MFDVNQPETLAALKKLIPPRRALLCRCWGQGGSCQLEGSPLDVHRLQSPSPP